MSRFSMWNPQVESFKNQEGCRAGQIGIFRFVQDSSLPGQNFVMFVNRGGLKSSEIVFGEWPEPCVP